MEHPNQGIVILGATIKDFESFLRENERSEATIQKYTGEIKRLGVFLHGAEMTKQEGNRYREWLRKSFKVKTINCKLSAINSWLSFMGLSDMKLKLLKVQKKPFTDEKRELSEGEYKRLLKAANSCRDERLYNVMLTICGTGIRISELKYITVDAVKQGYAEISLKGKERVVLIQKELRRRLLKYVKRIGITEGCVFITKSGMPLDRSNICHDMKRLCAVARVDKNKVFPHNLRHLFARSFYAVERNLAHLADVLGHSSIETTRIYVATSAKAHERILSRMKLII